MRECQNTLTSREMNIAILSMQRVLNYGSLLQAYSLKKVLEELGHNVSFIDIESREADAVLMGPKDYIAFEDEDLEEAGTLIEKVAKVRGKITWFKQKRMFLEFQRDTLGLTPNNNLRKYDCCVIGSDEVFNCLQSSKWGFTSQLLGNVNQANKVITYAASCGYTTGALIPERIKPIIKESLSNISAFSVRDSNTYDFVQTFISNTDIKIHLDPVAIGNFDVELQNISRRVDLPPHYCLIYAYSGRMNDKRTVEYIKKFCRKHQLIPIAVGGIHNWITKQPCLNPFETLMAFKKADFVITDTFHGAVFSAKYSKKFAVIKRESNKNKLGDLLTRLDLIDHLMKSIEDLDNIYMIEKNEAKMKELLEYETKRSIEYLERSINSC